MPRVPILKSMAGLVVGLTCVLPFLSAAPRRPLLLGKQKVISAEPLSRAAYLDSLRRNLGWFRDSGMLLGTDASEGVGERIVLVPDNPQISDIEKTFTGLRRDGAYLFSEMRRPDCNFETALAFYYGERLFGEEAYGRISRNILQYLRSSGLQILNEKAPEYGLWTWSSYNPSSYWSDDNTWNTILPLKLYLLSGEKEWMRRGLLAARGLLRYDRLLGDPSGSLQGRPHWGGMRAMALAYAYGLTRDPQLRQAALDYVRADYEGLILDRAGQPTKRPYTTSESSYFLLESSVIFAATGDPTALECVNLLGDYLISRQNASGAIPGETRWGASGDHIADLVYTQNWFTLAMWHAYQVTRKQEFEMAFLQSLNFLLSIQDEGSDPQTRGAWRGAFDTLMWQWGGTNLLEGGPGSIYTGWTNAPIAFTIAFYLTGDSLLPPQLAPAQEAEVRAMWKSLAKE